MPPPSSTISLMIDHMASSAPPPSTTACTSISPNISSLMLAFLVIVNIINICAAVECVLANCAAINSMVVHCVAVDLNCGRLCFSGVAANSAAMDLHGGADAVKSIAGCNKFNGGYVRTQAEGLR